MPPLNWRPTSNWFQTPTTPVSCSKQSRTYTPSPESYTFALKGSFPMFEKANYLLRGFMPAVLILGIFVIASAQGSVGSTRGLPDAAGGVHSIEGHVYMPSGRRAGPGIVVKLDGNVNGTKSAATDGDGAFLFRSLPAAEYYIVVDGGTEYESV